QFSECRRAAIGPEPVVGIYILANQSHLTNTRFSEPLELCNNVFNWTRHFSAACVGHDTERAELVASFLHRNESGYAAFGNRVTLGGGENVEFVLNGKFSVDNFLAALGPSNHVWQ